jgi:hypothetical protein
MRQIFVVLFLMLASNTLLAFSWSTYTNLSSNAQPLSITASDVISIDDYVYIFGTGNTLNTSAYNSIFKLPWDLSTDAILQANSLPKAGKGQKVFKYGNRLYYFPDHGPRTADKSRVYYDIYSAPIIAGNIGAWTRIGELPFYKDHPYSNRQIAQNPIDNSYYITGGQAPLGNVWSSGSAFVSSDDDFYLLYDYHDFFEDKTTSSTDVAIMKVSTDGTLLHPSVIYNNYNIIRAIKIHPLLTGFVISGQGAATSGYAALHIDTDGNSLNYISVTGPDTYNDSCVFNDHIYYGGFSAGAAKNNMVTVLDSELSVLWSQDYDISPAANEVINALAPFNTGIVCVGTTDSEFGDKSSILLIDALGNCTAALTVTSNGFASITTTAGNIFVGSYEGEYLVYDETLTELQNDTVDGMSGVYHILVDADTNTFTTVLYFMTGAGGTCMLRTDLSGNCITATAITGLVNLSSTMYPIIKDGDVFLVDGSNFELVKLDADGNSLLTGRRALAGNKLPITNNITYVKISGTAIVDSWTDTVPTDFLCSVYGSSIFYNNRLYLISGIRTEGISNAVPLYSFSTVNSIRGHLSSSWTNTGYSAPMTMFGDALVFNDAVYWSGATSPAVQGVMLGATFRTDGDLENVTYDVAVPTSTTFGMLAGKDNNLYHFGGLLNFGTAEQPSDSVIVAEAFTPTVTPTITDTPTPNLTPVVCGDWFQTTGNAGFSPRSSAYLYVKDSRMWLVGGRAAGSPVGDIWHTDLGVDWVSPTLASLYIDQYGGAAAQFLNYNYLLGGAYSGGSTNFAQVSTDLITWYPANTPGAGLHGAGGTTVVYNNKLYWIGGGDAGTGVGQAHVSVSANGVDWTVLTLNAEFGPLYDSVSVVFAGKMWIIGGSSAFSIGRDDIYSSTDGIVWTLETDNPGWAARDGHGVVVYDNKLWLFGGGDASTYYTDTWYSSDGINWTQYIPAISFPIRTDFNFTVMNNRIWAVAGMDDNNVYYSDAWYLVPGTATLTPTIKNTITLTPTITPTITATHTVSPTVTATVTATPYIIYYRTTLSTSISGYTYMDVTYGATVIDFSPQFEYFKNGYSVFPVRDNIQPNTEIIVDKQSTSFTLSIIDRTTKLPVDTSTYPTGIYYTILPRQ